MKIAILGWGSLVWDERGIPLDTGWMPCGPELPIELSRISSSRNDALTLVIDSTNGRYVRTYFALSKRTELEEAISDLCKRENMTSRCRIGYVNLVDGSERSEVIPGASGSIREWASQAHVDAVIWTDLGSNFWDKKKTLFSIEAAIQHLHDLEAQGARAAREYILNIPEGVNTDLLDELDHDSWLYP